MIRAHIPLILFLAPAMLAWPASASGTNTVTVPQEAFVQTTGHRFVTAHGVVDLRAPAAVDQILIVPFVNGVTSRVVTAPEHVTDIALEPGEILGSVASGDTARWAIVDMVSGAGDTRQAHVLIKPFATGLATNLIIATDRRVYHLTALSRSGPGMTVVSWTYPPDDLIALKRPGSVTTVREPAASGVEVDRLRFNYAISGDQPAWRPLRAFDDSRQTFIEMPATLSVNEAPPLFILGAKGQAQLVNYRLRGHYYIVDRIFDAAEFRLGTKDSAVVKVTRIMDARAQPSGKGGSS